MKLAYKAFDKAGRPISDVIDAPGAEEAAEELRRRDLFVADIKPVVGTSGPAGSNRGRFRLPLGRGKRLRNLAMFSRQLYVLVHSGTPLADGLRAMERQAGDHPWRNAIADVRERLEHGQTLAAAMASHPEYFDMIFRNMVAAGEASGKLPSVLNRLAQLTKKRLHIRSALRGALTYPCLLAVLTTGVLAVLLLFVIPRFAELFESLGVPVPPLTAMLISFSQALCDYWWAGLGLIVASAFGVKLYLGTLAGKRMLDTIVLRVPLFGKIVRDFASARVVRLLGVLMDSFLPVLEVLRLTRASTKNVHYAELLDRAEQAVSRGETISSALADTDLITPAVHEVTRSGEQSGQVASLLLDLADFLDEENEVTLRTLTSIVEPVMLVAIGLLVGLVATSVFLPLFDIGGSTGGGP